MLTPRITTAPVLALTPAVEHVLMAGEHARVRVPGWVDLATVPLGEEMAHLQTMWDAHRDHLMQEAAAHGFVPAWASQRRPRGAGFTRWRDQFLEQHRY